MGALKIFPLTSMGEAERSVKLSNFGFPPLAWALLSPPRDILSFTANRARSDSFLVTMKSHSLQRTRDRVPLVRS
jgi:hypothetical protein